MKILFISKDFTFNGGGERMLVNLANKLQTSIATNVDILSLDYSNKQSIYQLRNDINIIYANIKKKKINIFTKFNYINFLKRNISLLNQYDYVIGVGIIANLVLSIIAKKTTAKTIGWEHFSYQGTPFYQRILRKLFFKNLFAIVILTNQDYKRYKNVNKNVKVIYNFTEMKFRNRPLDNNQILFVGRISKQKGIKYLKKIINKICKVNKNVTFKIIGNGDLQKSLINYIAKKQLSERVKILNVSNDVQTELEQSACVIMTSIGEGLPMVLIEAQICGVPCVSFDTITGPSDIIVDNETGYIIPRYKVNDFVFKLNKLMKAKEIQETFSKKSLEMSKRFDSNIIISQWEALLSENL